VTSHNSFRIAVIGAGPTGIAAGVELLQQGFDNFVIYDKEAAAGGTWHMHSYPGLACDVFAGPSWHSSWWNHEVSLKDKRVVMIGSAAAAVQIAPEIAKEVAHLTILQRSANWILPRNNKPYSPFAIRTFKRFPFVLKALRQIQGILMNFVYHAVSNNSRTMNTFENLARKFIEQSISDPALRKAVTPDSRYGCKRPLVSDDFYPSLNRQNVCLKPVGANALVLSVSYFKSIEANVHNCKLDEFRVSVKSG